MTTDRGITEDQLYRIMYGSIAFQMLYAGSELGIFDHLSRHPGATAAEVAESTGIRPYPCDILLTGLRGLGMIVGNDSGLRNAPLIESNFAQGGDGKHLPFIQHIVNPGMAAFIESVEQGANLGLDEFPANGATLYDRLESDPVKLRYLHEHLRATSEVTLAGLIGTSVFENTRHVMDVGGGTGSNAIALATRYPHLRFTLVDLENVVTAAEENIAAAGLTDRISVTACDVFNEPLPVTDADTALVAHMLPIWSPDANQKLLRKIFEVLPDHGQVLLFDPVQNDDRDGPDYAILFPAYYLTIASGRGTFYPSHTYEEWMRVAGFTDFSRFTGLPVSHGLHIGRK
jgi:ubiquinone/menaquinone biosynthesis C-methylase UbiE